MPEFELSKLVFFLAFVVPGFVSMRVFALLRPTDIITLKSHILDAIFFGTINFALLIYPMTVLLNTEWSPDNMFELVPLVFIIFFFFPVIWPIALLRILRFLESKNLILSQAPTSWDHYFGQRVASGGCWAIAHLHDGRKIGGLFDDKSFASSYPRHGHLYMEELWVLDANGNFLNAVAQSQGVILRPEDYHFLELFKRN